MSAADNSCLRLGACGFTAPGWVGSFYPLGLSSREFLRYYAEEFSTVELDTTWYRVPTAETVRRWRDETPDGFVFAAKVPQAITHDKILAGCGDDMRRFVERMAELGPKLGSLLLQFPYFGRETFDSLGEFLAALEPFLDQAPAGFRYAVEVRNRDWVAEALLDSLRARRVAFAWTDLARMPNPAAVTERLEIATADFLYVRWLGDRAGIERITRTWDRTVVDRESDLDRWAELLAPVRQRGLPIYGFVNNHFAGHAPATIRGLLDRLAPLAEPRRARPLSRERTLFDLR